MSRPAPDIRTKARRTRWWSRLLSVVALCYMAHCTVLSVSQEHMIFPRNLIPDLAASTPPDVIELVRPIEDGRVTAWYLPPPVETDGPAPLLVYCHGNAELISHQSPTIRGYRKLGMAMLLPEYRGYGTAAGKPGQDVIRSDVLHFVEQVAQREEIDENRIAYHGHSLGAAIATDVAAKRPPAALILQAPFISLVKFAHRYAVPGFMLRHPYRTDRILPELDASVLIMHGHRDGIIPVRHGRTLHQLAPDSRYVEFDCGHNNLPGRGNETKYWGAIRELLEDAGVLR